MKRLKPGPFGGAFDEVDYENPAFVPLLLTALLLLFLFCAVVWALWRGRTRTSDRQARRHGFPVTPSAETQRRK